MKEKDPFLGKFQRGGETCKLDYDNMGGESRSWIKSPLPRVHREKCLKPTVEKELARREKLKQTALSDIKKSEKEGKKKGGYFQGVLPKETGGKICKRERG